MTTVQFARDEPVGRSRFYKEPLLALAGGLVGVVSVGGLAAVLLVYVIASGLWSVVVVLAVLAMVQLAFLRWRSSVIRRRLAAHGDGRDWAAFVRVSPVELAVMGRGRGMGALKLLTRWQFRFLVVDGEESYASQRVKEEARGPVLPITEVAVVRENAAGEIRRVRLEGAGAVEVDVLWSTPFPANGADQDRR
ncbi:MAG: hypothetical protein AAGA90_06520 [Actinomycetota bacterium]